MSHGFVMLMRKPLRNGRDRASFFFQRVAFFVLYGVFDVLYGFIANKKR